MSRRVAFLRHFALLSLATALTVAASPLKAAPQPNIVLILADDLGYGDLGYQGSTQIETPHIDSLAASGIAMAQGYVSAPVCGPSRAGLLTGRNQVSFGFDNNLVGNSEGFDPEYAGLSANETTFATRLQALGYRTGLVGKWHLGHLPQFHPLQRGFDEFWGFTGGGHSYFATVPNGQNEPKMESNVGAPPQITYLTDDLGQQSIEFIQRNKDAPFFLFASFNAPHAPMHATKEDLKLFEHIEDEGRRAYCAMVHRLDLNVGRIQKAIEKEGIAHNTLIVFLSDNGGPVDQNHSLNAPLNGQKGTLLEGGLRVPFIVSWPGVLPAGKTYHHAISSLDLAPTFLHAAGTDVSKDRALDGKNLLPFLKGDNQQAPHVEFKWRFTISAALRDGDWKLVRLPDRLPMLYNLSKDPQELRDVAMENLELTKSLLQRLGDWDVRQPHPHFLEGAVWRRRQLNLYDSQYPLAQPGHGETPVMIPHGETR